MSRHRPFPQLPSNASRYLLLSSLVLFAACAEEAPPPEVAIARPVKLFVVDENLSREVRQFPASIEAAKQAELSFRVSGQLEELSIREGDIVEVDQELAKLDPTDYRNSLEDAQATFDNTSRNYERAKELIDSGSISKLDYDRMEADFRSSRAALAQATTNLNYTTLQAPFRGRVARRYVDNFEEIRAKQPILFLQDPDILDVIIAMPESMVRSISASEEGTFGDTSVEDSKAAAEVRAMASFDNYPSIAFSLDIKEVATRADADTQTFRVTFSMGQPDEFTVLPGMTAQVEIDFSGLLIKDSVTWVPARAVQANEQLNPRVFVLDPDSMIVDSREITTGRLSGEMIEVLSGLSGGEEIVAVGAEYLSEGMAVTRMRSSEQAIPRESEI